MLLKMSIKKKEGLLLLAIAILQILMTIVTNNQSQVAGELLKALLDRNIPEFKKYLFYNISLYGISSLLKPTLTAVTSLLSLFWRRNLTKEMHSIYYSDMIYYKTNFLDNRLSNPDQLITKDVELYCNEAVQMYMKVIRPIINLIYFTYQLIAIKYSHGPITIITYMTLAVSIILMIAPNFGKLVAIQQSLEGEFRKVHSRIRTFCEPIAIYGGDEFERRIAEKRLEELTNHNYLILKKRFIYNMVYDILFKYFPHTVVWGMVSYPIFSGKYKNRSFGELISDLKYVGSMIESEFRAIGELLVLYRNLLQFSGYAKRVAKLFNVLRDHKRKNKENSKYKGKYLNGETIKFENVTIESPKGEVLGKNLTFEVKEGQNTIIIGPNGAGKSSLFRVLGGLWPLVEGIITKPGNSIAGLHNEIFYLPQKPYNCHGTLRNQIMYPELDDRKIPDDHFRKILEMVNLKHISTEYGFHKVYNWSNLSLGEQQKLAMARLFFHKPKFAILDECTSGITLDDEKLLYDKCLELKITCITISHRPALQDYHEAIIKFDGMGNVSYFKK